MIGFAFPMIGPTSFAFVAFVLKAFFGNSPCDPVGSTLKT